MRRLVSLLGILMLLIMPVSAMEFIAPEAPDSVQEFMPAESVSFGKDLLSVVSKGIRLLQPEFASAARECMRIVAIVLLVSLLSRFAEQSQKTVVMAGIVCISMILLKGSNTMITLGKDTVSSMSEYGKLLIPVLTAAMAAQGGGVSSTALYAGTAFFDSLLSTAISKFLVPLVYIFLVLSVASCATGENMLKGMCGIVKSTITWFLKAIIYVFTGYIGITGVVSGTADATALKATKLTISGMVPVIGGMLSDASEAVIVGAGAMKNAVGVYGLVAIAAIVISPFLKIGLQYLMLKVTAAVCEMLGVKEASEVIQSFSTAMGFLLGMTGAVCMMQMISIVCYMKGFH